MSIKLVVSEIDGVVTDGSRAEDEMGHVVYKTYQSKDFSAINEIKKNYKFVFLSDDQHINYNMCRRRNIPFFYGKNEHEKYDRLVEILRRYQCTPDETVFIASKVSDMKCINLIPKSFCPDGSGELLKEKCWAEFTTHGGRGVIVECLYLLKNWSNIDKIGE
jgi:3-deoxy-D-manno-octulosonate 8-phosphate phosphatase KdsC-like HAD superfamily phosphatase